MLATYSECVPFHFERKSKLHLKTLDYHFWFRCYNFNENKWKMVGKITWKTNKTNIFG